MYVDVLGMFFIRAFIWIQKIYQGLGIYGKDIQSGFYLSLQREGDFYGNYGRFVSF